MLNFFINAAKGFVLGISMALPGLSGGTMAFVMGIYEKLIAEISKFKLKRLKAIFLPLKNNAQAQKRKPIEEAWDWAFLAPLSLGAAAAIAAFVFLSDSLFQNYSLPFYSFVFGLAAASLFQPFKRMKKTKKTFLLLLASFLINISLAVLGEKSSLSFAHWAPFILLPAGFLVSAALIIPGLSGSYLLLILGLYEEMLFILRSADILSALWLFSGAALGIFLTARGIKLFMEKHFDLSMAAIIGLIAAGLYAVYPLPKESLEDIFVFDSSKRVFLFYFAAGAGALWIISLWTKKKKAES